MYARLTYVLVCRRTTQQGLVDNVMNGFAIVFPAAFVTLVAATRNVVISAYAILTCVPHTL
eukprot:COSAG01_NODE_49_length_31891_cov_29.945773_7_plen_61_part_00